MLPASTTATPPTSPPRRRDGFLDAIKVIALWSVVVWHALAWPWLSWFAAMPAMFYVAGVLLQQSIDRHGFVTTLTGRLGRLLVPFWAYGAAAVAVMALGGWRPRLDEFAWWIVPILDPAGSSAAPGFWVPLWYLRAYLWVLLAGAALSWACRRFGFRVLIVPVVATGVAWWWQQSGNSLPLAVADAALFPFFVMAGMLTTLGVIEPTARRMVPIGAAAAALGLVWYLVEGAPDGIVNASLPLHLLIGIATLGLLVGVRGPLASPGPRIGRFVSWSSSRAFTIYLWHGAGLVVADRVVHRFDLASPVASGLGLVVVLCVTLAAASLFGRLEDVSADRPARRAPWVVSVAVAPAGLLVAVALVLGDPDEPRMVPSGEVIMARAAEAEVTDGALGDLGARGGVVAEALDSDALREVFDEWIADNAGLLEELDSAFVEISVVDTFGGEVILGWTDDGSDTAREVYPWMSMTKAFTAAWMMDLVDDGTIRLDEPVATYLPDVPHSDRFTFEQLASHRAGLPAELDGNLLEARPVDDIEAFLSDPHLKFEPGEGYGYSRVGYYLLTWALEEASGTSWPDAMRELATDAGVEVVIDEELSPRDRVTHPGNGTYRGILWGSGGLNGTSFDGAHLLRHLLMDALDEDDVRLMTSVAPGSDGPLYGLGIAPICPCVSDEGRVGSNRAGLSALTGSFVVDLSTGVGVMMHVDNWWSDDGPALEFDDLVASLLDAAGEGGPDAAGGPG